MRGRIATVLAAALCTVPLDRPTAGAADAQTPPAAKPAAAAAGTSDPLALTRSVLTRSNEIVRGPGDRKQKLQELSDLLRGFLDTNALARLAAGKNLDGRSPAEVDEFLKLFHEFFVRTYVQRLLLFDAPEFAFGQETVEGDQARVATEVVTPGDRFAVDYQMHRNPEGWRATDIIVEGVSLARNFRSQFDAAVAKDSFQGLLDRLRAKVQSQQEGS
jgi:phospholipid transport system substrate-binding protein